MAAVQVFYSRLQQRHIFGFYGPVDRCFAKDRLANVQCDPRAIDSGCEGQSPLNGIAELDKKYFGFKPRYKIRGETQTRQRY